MVFDQETSEHTTAAFAPNPDMAIAPTMAPDATSARESFLPNIYFTFRDHFLWFCINVAVIDHAGP